MKFFINMVYGFMVISMFTPCIISAMLQYKNNGAMQQEATLDFLHNNQSVAHIPASIAVTLSPVFCAQLNCPMDQERFKIDVDEFTPETVKLFADIVNAYDKKFVVLKKLIEENSNHVLDLYHFLNTYEIDTCIPLVAKQFVSALASTREIYNLPTFPFDQNKQLQIVAQTL